MRSGTTIERTMMKFPRDVVGDQPEVVKEFRIKRGDEEIIIEILYYFMEHTDPKTGKVVRSYFTWIEDVNVRKEVKHVE